MSIYGTPQLLCDGDTTDKIGIRKLVLSIMWQPVGNNLNQTQIDAQKPGVPTVSGGTLLVGTQTRRSAGAYKTTWTFEGIEGDGKTVTFQDRTNSLDYNFEPGLSQVSIKLWRGLSGNDSNAYQNLLTQYQGTADINSDQIIWQPTLSGNATSIGLAGPGNTDTLNPMFGVQDWFRMEGNYTYRYASLNIPSSLLAGSGLVASNLPGQPPPAQDGRNWLKVPPLWRRRGLIFDISETYWLSGIGGWPAPIYGTGQGGSQT